MKVNQVISFLNLTITIFAFQECSPNEVFVECSASCQPFCGSSFNDTKNLDCGCVHGCVCKPGLIRSKASRKCISIRKCHQILLESNETKVCGENEIFSATKASCQPSCFTRKFSGSRNCQVSSGCVCREGFIRDVKFGDCIPVEKCPSKLLLHTLILNLLIIEFSRLSPG